MTELATLLTRTALAIALVLAASAAWCHDAVQVRIIAINDFHGHLEPGDNAVQVPDPFLKNVLAMRNTPPDLSAPVAAGAVVAVGPPDEEFVTARLAHRIVHNTRDYAEHSTFLKHYLDKLQPIYPPVDRNRYRRRAAADAQCRADAGVSASRRAAAAAAGASPAGRQSQVSR